jgi:hypothetical protein
MRGHQFVKPLQQRVNAQRVAQALHTFQIVSEPLPFVLTRVEDTPLVARAAFSVIVIGLSVLHGVAVLR